ncbi:hypothetical protein BaRGS_00025736 [Batillaria attramentaria]|uniref:Zn(2)-C6 fungal-type domain-containing protein n=1 Tax=Batillaria attramentaria TaxID=370345 RepID=A0ABD0K7R6_9CAEN
MPVLVGNTKCSQLSPSEYEVEKLVEEVRERLCLKSREKLNAVRRSPYGITHGGGPRRKGSSMSAVCTKCNCARRHVCSTKSDYCRDCMYKCVKSGDSGSDLLKKLIAEQRLIQEAVRRIQAFHHQHGDASSASGACLPIDSPPSVASSTTSIDSSSFSSTSAL